MRSAEGCSAGPNPDPLRHAAWRAVVAKNRFAALSVCLGSPCCSRRLTARHRPPRPAAHTFGACLLLCCSACVATLSFLRPFKLEGSSGSTPEASTPASLQSTPSGIRSPAGDGAAAALGGSPSPPRQTLQLAADRLAALRSSSRSHGHGPRGCSSAAGSSRAATSLPRPAASGPAPAAARWAQPSVASVAAAASAPPAVAASVRRPVRPAAVAAPAAAPWAPAAAPGSPTPVDHLLALADHAQLVQADADVLRDGLRGARRQLAALQAALGAMQRQAVRQQHALAAVLMEQECELKLARSEAEAYRTAARARTAAVSTLQRCAGVGMAWGGSSLEYTWGCRLAYLDTSRVQARPHTT